MIIKKIILKQSDIEGLGVFADENIKKGDQICDYDSEVAKNVK